MVSLHEIGDVTLSTHREITASGLQGPRLIFTHLVKKRRSP